MHYGKLKVGDTLLCVYGDDIGSISTFRKGETYTIKGIKDGRIKFSGKHASFDIIMLFENKCDYFAKFIYLCYDANIDKELFLYELSGNTKNLVTS